MGVKAVKLGKREKVLISLSLALICLFFLFQLIVFPFLDERETIKRGIETKRKGLKEIRALKAQYESYTKGAEGVERQLKRRANGFTLFSFLEQAAGKAGIKEHIKYMKPSDSPGQGRLKESMVEMKLEGINLRQLVDYLYLIESPEHLVSIKRISIKESRTAPEYIDTIMQAVTVMQ